MENIAFYRYHTVETVCGAYTIMTARIAGRMVNRYAFLYVIGNKHN